MKKNTLNEQRKFASRRYRKKCDCLLFLVDIYYEILEKNQELKEVIKKLGFSEPEVVYDKDLKFFGNLLDSLIDI